MYHIHPLSVVPETIDLPKCMYNIKPLNAIQLESYRGELSPSNKRVKMDPELQAIEDRQLDVIARLRKLRDTVDGLISKANVGEQQQASKRSESLIKSQSAQKSGSMGPKNPPTAATLSNVDQKLVSLFSRDTTAPSNSTIRVVWKNGPGSRLTPPTLGSCGVEGESNVARYLSRVLAKPDDSVLNYDALPLEDLVLVDGVLESSSLVDNAPEQFLNSLQVYVQTRSGSGGASRTIADFVGYSTLRYLTKQQPGRSFQKSLIDWMNCLTNEVPSLC